MSFKDEINIALNTELESDAFVMDIITRFQQAIRNSITKPGVEEWCIMRISDTEPLTENQISKVKMACVKHIGVHVDVTTWEMLVKMENFLV
jgi:hypothetical protein